MKTETTGTQMQLWEEPVSISQADPGSVEEKEQKTPHRGKTVILALTIYSSKGEKVWSGEMDPRENLEFLLRLSRSFGTLYGFDGCEKLLQKQSSHAMRRAAAIVVEKGMVLFSRSLAEKIGIIRKR